MCFVMIYCTEKITDVCFPNGIVFCLCSGNRIHQFMHHFPDHFLVYTLSEKNEVINARVY